MSIRLENVSFSYLQNTPMSQAALRDVSLQIEDGEFTPYIMFGVETTGITYSARTGVYTKIGRVVVFHLNLALSSKGTKTGAVLIGGLPFSNVDMGKFVAYPGRLTLPSNIKSVVASFSNPNLNSLLLMGVPLSTDSNLTVQSDHIADNFFVQVSGVYQTAS